MTPVAHPSSMQQFVRYARLTGIPLEDILDRELWSIVQSSATREPCPRTRWSISCRSARSWRTARNRRGLCILVQPERLRPAEPALGPLPDGGETIRVSNRFLHLESDALGVRSIETEDEIALVQFVTIPTRFGGSQFVEATLSLQVRILRLVLGADWSPVRVEFDHPPPRNLNLHRTFFRCPTAFGADRSAVVIRREEMKRTNPNGNAHLLAISNASSPRPCAPACAISCGRWKNLSPRIWRADRPRWSAPPRCCDWRAQPATPAGRTRDHLRRCSYQCTPARCAGIFRA
jgi:hypothetical protein